MTEVEVRRSARRRRTISARREGGRIVVLIPAGHSARQEREWVAQMVSRLESRGRRRTSDEGLAARAAELSQAYLGGLARPSSIVWVSNQRHRWGSCTPADGTIRISDRVAPLPGWVQDYVILHELAHLLQPGHGPDFWKLLRSYPKLERAKGYLEGYAHARADGPGGEPGSGDCTDD